MDKYILSVICAAILCAVTASIADKKGSTGGILKLISGIFLTFTMIQPISSVKLEELTIFTADLTSHAQAAAAMGEQISRESLIQRIKQKTEAYILDKATNMGAAIRVQVRVGEDLLPKSAILSGKISPAGKKRLENLIEADLGIPKENLQWSES